MPFVSSVRGGYGLSKRPFPEFLLNVNNSGITGGSVTTAGGYRIHTYGYTGGDQTFSVTSPTGNINGADVILKNVEMYIYGAGGGAGQPQSWGRWSSGAGGGFASGTVSRMFSDTFNVVVPQGGGGGNTGRSAYGGGGAGVSWGNGGGSGYGGVFQNNTRSQANAVLIAGGGGGGGASRVASDGCGSGNRGGAGGGSVGQDGESVDTDANGKGGTQSAGGLGANRSGSQRESGTALQGGNASSHGAGGAGGYFGGGAGDYFEPNSMGGGGGGSSYFKPSGTNAVTSAILTSGDRCTTANTGGIYYSGSTGVSGQSTNAEGQPGRVVIRYLTS